MSKTSLRMSKTELVRPPASLVADDDSPSFVTLVTAAKCLKRHRHRIKEKEKIFELFNFTII